MIRDVYPRSRIRILIFNPSLIPEPGVKKAQDSGSRSATLLTTVDVLNSVYSLILAHCAGGIINASISLNVEYQYLLPQAIS
jgi:hypothetical protein